MNIERMENFERYWAHRYGGSPEGLARHRFVSREGYGLPGMAAHYRTYCDTLDSLGVLMPLVVGASVQVVPA